MRGLLKASIDAHILLTKPDEHDPKPLPLPQDIPINILQVRRGAGWSERWGAIIHYLEKQAPCIYLPNYDFWHSSVSPRLSPRIGVVGIIHSDDPQHYEHVLRLGAYWNAIVAVSRTIARKTVDLSPELKERLVTIPYGVPTPPQMYQRKSFVGPLRVIYAGRLIQQQKRVLDLPRIMEGVVKQGIPIEFTIVGAGPEEAALHHAFAAIQSPLFTVTFAGIIPNQEVFRLYEQNDVFILTSEYEGLPLSLLESMGRGCAPVVTEIQSGVPELIKHGVNGFLTPIGDIRAFQSSLAALFYHPEKRHQLGANAYRSIMSGGYSQMTMTKRYIDLFIQVLSAMDAGTFHRPKGSIHPPKSLAWHNQLSSSVRTLRRLGKRFITRSTKDQ